MVGPPRRLRRRSHLDRIGRDCPLLGWFLIISGVLQGRTDRHAPVPYFWCSDLRCAIVIGCCYAIPMRGCSFSALLIIHFMIEGIAGIFTTIRPFPTGTD